MPETLEIADREEPTNFRVTEILIAVFPHRGNVVGATDAIVAHFLVSLHTSNHVGLAVIVEGLDKIGGLSLHITEVHKEDLLLLAKFTDDPGQVICHQREVALTQRDATHLTGMQVQQSLEVVDTVHDSGSSLDQRNRGIVWMHGELDACRLCFGNHGIQEVLQVVPELLFGEAIFVLIGIRHIL